MNKSDAIKAFGSVAKLARELGISVQAVYKWPDTVPEPRAWELRGRRPDLFCAGQSRELRIDESERRGA